MYEEGVQKYVPTNNKTIVKKNSSTTNVGYHLKKDIKHGTKEARENKYACSREEYKKARK